MMIVDTKTNSSTSSPLGLNATEEEPTLSFSQLLKGASKDGANLIQNGVLVLALGKESKFVEKAVGTNDALLSLLKNDTGIELNPTLTQSLSTQDLKTLLADAKSYLKSKIMDSDGYKKASTKELPKTLKGLVALSKQFGIDVSKLSMQEVQVAKKDFNTIKNIETRVQKENTQELKQTPLFKAQTLTQHTTQQVVATKLVKPEIKTVKEKVDDSLKLLLRADKPSNTKLTAEFSVATAKVIAPSASSDIPKSLESLLHGDLSESPTQTSTTKTDALAVHKSDSFEVKLNEAKQMIKYLSQDVKTAIEDYKSPFTRVKIQLNPQKLGEIDLTIVQRGKNLHINLSSNSSAINTLTMNVNELRVQLNNSGINNATLNFNNQQDASQNHSQKEQNRQNEQKADEEYAYFNDEQNNEEIISSLEIVVPSYA